MDTQLYKAFATSRGIKYSYFFSPAQPLKPTLLLLHGFPSTARDWRHIVPYFKERGYGVVAPDMLGYGGTDKPVDPAAYVSSLISKDIVEILDAEKLDKVIGVGHDWGAKALSRLANYYPERFLAYAWLAVPFVAPSSPVDFSVIQQFVKQRVGYDMYGYWLFFSEDDADKVIQEHMDSFMSILWPHDPSCWKDRMAPTGALRKSLLEDFRTPLPSYLTEEDKQEVVKTFREGGFAAPTCWYKIMTSGLNAQDDQQIKPDHAYPPATAPVFFGAAKLDYVCPAANGHAMFESDAFKQHQVTIKDYDADHWLILSHGSQISRDLEAWILSFSSPQKAHI